MNGLYGQGRFLHAQVVFLQPQTYMNRSGICVRQFLDFFNIPIDNMLVIHDDLDMNSGRLKIVAGGGTGGHNGIKSIIQHVGTRQFCRAKYGIGRPQDERQSVEKYVLSRFSREDMDLVKERGALVLQAAEIFVGQGIDRCMNTINGITS